MNRRSRFLMWSCASARREKRKTGGKRIRTREENLPCAFHKARTMRFWCTRRDTLIRRAASTRRARETKAWCFGCSQLREKRNEEWTTHLLPCGGYRAPGNRGDGSRQEAGSPASHGPWRGDRQIRQPPFRQRCFSEEHADQLGKKQLHR